MSQHRRSSPGPSGNPSTLIHTWTMRQSNDIDSQLFNPYTACPSKTILKLNGDLDTMAAGWTKKECESQRRLVQFTRTKAGSTIHANFKPVFPEERAQNSICISCIVWEGKDECYITSVDIIYLLEALIGSRFTVEKKNRIRRKLEGFRPVTVSKAKEDSERFFKVIMSFPAPKPRSIKKEIKVFSWKILGHALEKMIGKLSASYPLTVSALPTPMGDYAVHTGSDAGTDKRTTPQSVFCHGVILKYSTITTTPVYSTQPDQSCDSLTTASDLRSVVPSATQSYPSVGTFPYPAMCQPHTGHRLVSSSPRTKWEMRSFDASSKVAGVAACEYYGHMSPIYPLYDVSQGS